MQFYLKCRLAPANTYNSRIWSFYSRFVHQRWIRSTPLGHARFWMDEIQRVVEALPSTPGINIRAPAKRVYHHQVSGYGFLPQQHAPLCTPLQRRPPPCYIIPFPNWVNNTPILPDSLLRVYTDGSSDPNPGRSTSAWKLYPAAGLRLNWPLPLQGTVEINYPCATNVAELNAIYDIINLLHNFSYVQKNRLPENLCVKVFCDSETCVNIFTESYYPHFEFYWDMIESIFLKMSDLYFNAGVTFHFEHVRAHQDNSTVRCSS